MTGKKVPTLYETLRSDARARRNHKMSTAEMLRDDAVHHARAIMAAAESAYIAARRAAEDECDATIDNAFEDICEVCEDAPVAGRYRVDGTPMHLCIGCSDGPDPSAEVVLMTKAVH